MIKVILIRYFIVLNLLISALYANDSIPLTVKQMHEDIDFYFHTVSDNNPATYRKFSELFLDSIKIQLKATCNTPLTNTEFNYHLSKTNKYFDIHTGINMSFLTVETKKFPFLEITSDEMNIENFSILKIENIGSKQLIDDLDKMVSWEYNDNARIKYMNIYLNDLLQSYYNLDPPYNCTIRNTTTDEIKDTLIHPISYHKWHTQYQPSYDTTFHMRAMDAAYYLKDSIAIFYYNTSLKPQEHQIELYNSVVESFFQIIKNQGVNYLFIDVTQNGGGSDETHDYLYKYLKGKPYKKTGTIYISKFKQANMVRKWKEEIEKAIIEYKKEHPECVDKGYDEMIKIFNKDEEERKQIEIFEIAKRTGKYPFNIKMEGNESGFDGKVFILMGWSTASAAADFCEEVKLRQIGLLVGEEPLQRFPYSGDIKSKVLPNSKIPFKYGTNFFTIEPDVTNAEGFIEPDIPYSMDHPLQLEDYKKIIELSR